MHIGIFSENTKISYYIGECIVEFAETKYLSATTVLYSTIWEYLNDPKALDVAIVDERFSKHSAVEVARIIRSKNKSTAIILLSDGKENLLESVNLNLHSFILKPISQQSIYEALDNYVKKLSDERIIVAQVDGISMNFFTSEIYYIEAAGKGTIIATRKGEYFSDSTFGKLELQLNEERFYTIHRSYCINMNLIKSFTDEIVTMRNQHILPISRRRKIDFLIAFGRFAKRNSYMP